MAEGRLVNQTDFEGLIARINDEVDKEKDLANKRQSMEQPRLNAVRAISSVKIFLDINFGLPKQYQINIDEYKIVSEKLRQLAIYKTSSFWYRFFHCFKTRRWKFYLEHNYFSFMVEYSKEYNSYQCFCYHNPFSAYLYNYFIKADDKLIEQILKIEDKNEGGITKIKELDESGIENN